MVRSALPAPPAPPALPALPALLCGTAISDESLPPCASLPRCRDPSPRRYPVNAVWKLLPWNGGPFDGRPPVCRMRVVYLDEQMRISRDAGGGLFVYTRPMAAPTARGPGGADDTA